MKTLWLTSVFVISNLAWVTPSVADPQATSTGETASRQSLCAVAINAAVPSASVAGTPRTDSRRLSGDRALPATLAQNPPNQSDTSGSNIINPPPTFPEVPPTMPPSVPPELQVIMQELAVVRANYEAAEAAIAELPRRFARREEDPCVNPFAQELLQLQQQAEALLESLDSEANEPPPTSEGQLVW